MAVAKSSNGTLLFDEIEKAYPRVLDVFLQVLDAARVTMANGEVLDLSGFYIVFTSNIGGAELLNLQHSSFTTMERFSRLSYDVQLDIARMHIARELGLLRDQGFDMVAGERVVSFLIQRGFHPRLGARPLRDAVEKYLRGAVADAVLAELPINHGEYVVCGDELLLKSPPVRDQN